MCSKWTYVDDYINNYKLNIKKIISFNSIFLTFEDMIYIKLNCSILKKSSPSKTIYDIHLALVGQCWCSVYEMSI